MTKPLSRPRKNPARRSILPNPAKLMHFLRIKSISLNMADNKIKSKINKTTFKNINVKEGATISPKLISPSKVIFFKTVCKTTRRTAFDKKPTENRTSLIF